MSDDYDGHGRSEIKNINESFEQCTDKVCRQYTYIYIYIYIYIYADIYVCRQCTLYIYIL